MTTRAGLQRAFDRAIAAADRAARAGTLGRDGRPAAARLAALRDELVRARADAVENGAVDPGWVRDLVRSTADWLPDDAIPLLAALGGIARASRPTRER